MDFNQVGSQTTFRSWLSSTGGKHLVEEWSRSGISLFSWQILWRTLADIYAMWLKFFQLSYDKILHRFVKLRRTISASVLRYYTELISQLQYEPWQWAVFAYSVPDCNWGRRVTAPRVPSLQWPGAIGRADRGGTGDGGTGSWPGTATAWYPSGRWPSPSQPNTTFPASPLSPGISEANERAVETA